MVEPNAIEILVNSGEQQIRKKKRTIALDSLIKQLNGLGRLGHAGLKCNSELREQFSGLRVKLEGAEIARRFTFNRQFLSRRDFRTELDGNFLRNLALNREQII